MAGVTLVTHQGSGVSSQLNQHELVAVSTQGDRLSKKLGKWSRIEEGNGCRSMLPLR
jgi:hypothetical protein